MSKQAEINAAVTAAVTEIIRRIITCAPASRTAIVDAVIAGAGFNGDMLSDAAVAVERSYAPCGVCKTAVFRSLGQAEKSDLLCPHCQAQI